jgi:hypothetical protein
MGVAARVYLAKRKSQLSLALLLRSHLQEIQSLLRHIEAITTQEGLSRARDLRLTPESSAS